MKASLGWSPGGIRWTWQVPPAPRLPRLTRGCSVINGCALQSRWHLPCPAGSLAPRSGLAWTVPPTAGELRDQGGTAAPLVYLAGLEHDLDFPASLIPLVTWWQTKTRNFASFIVYITKTALLQPPRELGGTVLPIIPPRLDRCLSPLGSCQPPSVAMVMCMYNSCLPLVIVHSRILFYAADKPYSPVVGLVWTGSFAVVSISIVPIAFSFCPSAHFC